VFGNGLLRKIFGPKRDKTTEDWSQLQSEELHDFITKYYPGDQIKKNEMGSTCSTCGLKEGFGGETCEHGNEPSDSVKHEFLD
jgi:hypothetical protein